MRFEWDAEKNRRNHAKHKVSFEAARLVFDDPWALSFRESVVGERNAGKPSEWPAESLCC